MEKLKYKIGSVIKKTKTDDKWVIIGTLENLDEDKWYYMVCRYHNLREKNGVLDYAPKAYDITFNNNDSSLVGCVDFDLIAQDKIKYIADSNTIKIVDQEIEEEKEEQIA